MRLALTVGVAFVALVGALGVLLAPGGHLDAYVVLLLVGLLVIREAAGPHVTRALATRLRAFAFAGLVAFAVIVAQRLRDAFGA